MEPGGEFTECSVLVPANYKISRLDGFFSPFQRLQLGGGAGWGRQGKVPVQPLSDVKEEEGAKSIISLRLGPRELAAYRAGPLLLGAGHQQHRTSSLCPAVLRPRPEPWPLSLQACCSVVFAQPLRLQCVQQPRAEPCSLPLQFLVVLPMTF